MEIHNLVTGLVADDNEEGAVAGFDAIFDESSDAVVDFLPHCSLYIRVRVRVPFLLSLLALLLSKKTHRLTLSVFAAFYY